ncbi:four helix bundle protein [Candidatus Margulisiibacteriota bacterium]
MKTKIKKIEKKEIDFQNEEIYKDVLDYIKHVYELIKYYQNDDTYDSAYNLNILRNIKMQNLVSQFENATKAILLNIVQGLKIFKRSEKAKYFNKARFHTVECTVLLDILKTSLQDKSLDYSKLEEKNTLLTGKIDNLIRLWG